MPWNRRSSVAQGITPSAPVMDQVVSSMDVAHIMERKIHSDLNGLTRELQILPKEAEVFEQDRNTPFRNQSTLGEHRMLSWFSRQEEREEDNSESSRPEGPCGLQWSPLEIGSSINISGTDPPVSITEAAAYNDGSIERGPHRKLPSFGRRPRRHSFHSSKGTERSESQSSLSQAIDCTPSPSCSSKSETVQTPDHTHCRSFYPYAPHAQGATQLHSPHTFGMPTPSPSRTSSRSRGETHFHSKKTIPPPLPPLDHPVFREKVDEFGVLSTKLFFPVPEKVRHARSLPSIAKKATNSTGGLSKKKLRKRSQSSTGEGQSNPGAAEFATKAFHSRTSSKTSISSRRSSAEYSAKQASSLDHNGCWEVDVSKAIINLSLQEKKIGSTRALMSNAIPMSGSAPPGMIAFPGQTCGNNVGVP